MRTMSLRPFVWRLRDLAEISHLKGVNTRAAGQLRQKLEIAVLDDEREDIYRNLKQRGYRITEFARFEELSPHIAQFSIFVCDIKGVADQSEKEGVYAIEEIKKYSPLSYVICYTSMSPNDRRTFLARNLSDFYARKRADVSDFGEYLDKAITVLSSPVLQWNRIRSYFIEHNVSSKELSLLEHYWVKAIIRNDSDIFRKGFHKLDAQSDLDLELLFKQSVIKAVEIGGEAGATKLLAGAAL